MEKSLPLAFEDHSENFQNMVSRTERYGELEKPDGYGVFYDCLSGVRP